MPPCWVFRAFSPREPPRLSFFFLGETAINFGANVLCGPDENHFSQTRNLEHSLEGKFLCQEGSLRSDLSPPFLPVASVGSLFPFKESTPKGGVPFLAAGEVRSARSASYNKS